MMTSQIFSITIFLKICLLRVEQPPQRSLAAISGPECEEGVRAVNEGCSYAVAEYGVDGIYPSNSTTTGNK